MNNALEMYDRVCIYYGIKPMAIEEEWSQPDFAKKTRNNKMKGIDTCHHMRNVIETLEITLRAAPELDDQVHAALVQKLCDKIYEAYQLIETARMIGH